MIRVHATIPIALNDFLKKCAKLKRLNADEYIGGQIVEYNQDFLDTARIDAVAAYAKEQLGPDWREKLEAAQSTLL